MFVPNKQAVKTSLPTDSLLLGNFFQQTRVSQLAPHQKPMCTYREGIKMSFSMTISFDSFITVTTSLTLQNHSTPPVLHSVYNE